MATYTVKINSGHEELKCESWFLLADDLEVFTKTEDDRDESVILALLRGATGNFIRAK